MKKPININEVLMWIALYGVYWYISCVLSNIQFISNTIGNDLFSLIFPLILIYLTYIILKSRKKTLNKPQYESNNETILSNSKFFKSILLIIAIVISAFIIALFILFFIIMPMSYAGI